MDRFTFTREGTMLTRFRNRTLAGERLAERLTAYSGRPDVLLALLLGRYMPILYN